jgi:hypothetical protein
MSNQDAWHVSKSVPATLLFGLLTQAAAIVWTVSMMLSDIESNRADIIQMQMKLVALEEIVQGQAVAMARIDENIKAIRNVVELWANDR